MKHLTRGALTVFFTVGAAAWSAGDQGTLGGSLPQVAMLHDAQAAPISISFVAVLVFASLVAFLAMSAAVRPYAASVGPIPRQPETGLGRAQRELATVLLQQRHPGRAAPAASPVRVRQVLS